MGVALAVWGLFTAASCSGDDDDLKKWACTCHSRQMGACAETESDAEGLFDCDDVQSGNTTFFGIVKCMPTGDSCTCPDRAPCEIAAPQ